MFRQRIIQYGLWVILIFVFSLFVIFTPYTYISFHEQTQTYERYDEAFITMQIISVLVYLHSTDGSLSAEYYSFRELIHMQDVKNIFHTVMVLGTLFSCVWLYLLVGQKHKTILHKSSKQLLVVIILASILVTLFFQPLFILFHKVAFTNTFWLLPQGSLLLILFPEQLFAHIVLLIFTLVFLAAFTIFSVTK